VQKDEKETRSFGCAGTIMNERILENHLIVLSIAILYLSSQAVSH